MIFLHVGVGSAEAEVGMEMTAPGDQKLSHKVATFFTIALSNMKEEITL